MGDKDLQETRMVVEKELENVENMIFDLESYYLKETDKSGKPV